MPIASHAACARQTDARSCEHRYLPFRYMVRVKRPGERVIRHKVILNHLVPVILAAAWTSIHPLIHATASACLVIAFWCIYEVGYYENDVVAERYERAPVLSAEHATYRMRVIEWQAWAVALIASIIGLVLLGLSELPVIDLTRTLTAHPGHSRFVRSLFENGILWIASLVFLRSCYLAYNYLDKYTRVWLFSMLQACKFLSLALLTHVSMIGYALLIALTIAEWIPYVAYRFEGKQGYVAIPRNWLRTMCFLLLLIAASIYNRNLQAFTDDQFIMILGWYLMRSRSDLKRAWRYVHPIWKDKLYN